MNSIQNLNLLVSSKEIELTKLSKLAKAGKKIAVVDGRVFSTEAGNRGMGRYTNSIIKYLTQSNFNICLILYKNFNEYNLNTDISPYLVSVKLIDIDPAKYDNKNIHENSYLIDCILKEMKADLYIDSTPFLSPLRFDITYCPIITIAYDLIPMRYPDYYLFTKEVKEVYESGLERLRKSDSIIAISKYVKNHIVKYLGYEADRISVIYPDINEKYIKTKIKNESKIEKGIFSIIGGHKSKNPESSLKILQNIKKSLNKDDEINVCVPTQIQLTEVKSKINNTQRVNFLCNISETEKINLQKNSKVIAHLSLEEGFGIPLVEALFLNSHVIVIDNPLNREIIEYSGNSENIAVFIDPMSTELDAISAKKLKNLLKTFDSNAFEEFKKSFVNHWNNAHIILFESYINAKSNFEMWNKSVKYYIVSNTPSNFCGVADYCSAFPSVKTNNSVIYTKDIVIKKVNAFKNVKVKSYLNFPDDINGNMVPVIFNLAFSDSLSFGVDLLKDYAKEKDIVIFHDMVYLYSLYSYYLSQNRIEEYYEKFFVMEDKDLVEIVKEILKGRPHDHFQRICELEKLYSSAWLRNIKCKLICHTPLILNENFSGFNPLLKKNMKFVSMGIDDRSKAVSSKISREWRRKKGIEEKDILLSVIGSITNNKYLVELSNTLVDIIKSEEKRRNNKIYFLLCGRPADIGVFNYIINIFKNNELQGNLLNYFPISEVTLDHIITASDAIICLRRQDRIQLSHSFVRSISLGKPIISNESTGFYQNDEFSSLLKKDVSQSIQEYLDSINSKNVNLFSEESRNIYTMNHEVKEMLNKLLNEENE